MCTSTSRSIILCGSKQLSAISLYSLRSIGPLFRRDLLDRFPTRKILVINILFWVVLKRRGGVPHAMRSLKIPRLRGPAPGTPAFGETAIENKLLGTPGTSMLYSTTVADPHSSHAALSSLEFM